MDALKGQARTIITLKNPLGSLELVTYLDESWGIVRDGLVFCIWEPAESGDCLRTFAHLWRIGRATRELGHDSASMLVSAWNH
jgi:hypothetical protein